MTFLFTEIEPGIYRSLLRKTGRGRTMLNDFSCIRSRFILYAEDEVTVRECTLLGLFRKGGGNHVADGQTQFIAVF